MLSTPKTDKTLAPPLAPQPANARGPIGAATPMAGSQWQQSGQIPSLDKALVITSKSLQSLGLVFLFGTQF